MSKRRPGQIQSETAPRGANERTDEGAPPKLCRERSDKVQLSDNAGAIDALGNQIDFISHDVLSDAPLAGIDSRNFGGAGRTGKVSGVPPLSKAGHRDRLRARFRDGGAEAMPDYELLELVLFRAIARRDTKDLAKRLLAKFGTFAEVVNAPARRIKEVPGAGESVVTELKVVSAAAVRMMRSHVSDKPVLSTWESVLQYIRAAQAFEDAELFRILFLDKRNRLIGDEVQGRGTVDHTPVYIREVVKRSLELSSTAIILVHNHPSGDPSPSRADIEMTRLICDAAKPLGIAVHDHIIVGREGHASLKALKLM